ncbi:AraC family transcriptional regulator [Lewinellaceae bacterium SD302]|nr:AraC family transcriptional regulator [Lewinellaceae bacterium SD302]
MQPLLNQLVFFAFFQSIFLLLIFGLSSKYRRRINGYFIVFVAVLLIGLSGRILLIGGWFGSSSKLITLSEFATLLFGVTIYLFTRSTLLKRQFDYRDLLHYVPALIYNLIMIFGYLLLPREVLLARIESGAFLQFVTFFVGFGLFFNFLYWGLSIRIFLRVRQELNNEASYAVTSRFFLVFLLAVGICLLIWLGVYLVAVIGNTFISRPVTQTIWLGISLLILLLAYYGFREPDLYQVAPEATTNFGKYATSKFSTKDLDRLKEELDDIMERQKPYLNQKLLKAELAELMGISNPELARLLNEKIGMNFFQYVNYYRIREFIELAESERGKQLTFFGLAQEAGFNSKTTFNKSFRQLMGSSPSEYLKKR